MLALQAREAVAQPSAPSSPASATAPAFVPASAPTLAPAAPQPPGTQPYGPAVPPSMTLAPPVGWIVPPPAADEASRARDPRPERLEWRPGEVVPPGYAPSSEPDYALLTSGAVVFGSGYVPSFIAAWVGTFSNEAGLAPLFVPVVGPLVTIGTAKAEEAGVYVLALDAALQALGASLFVVSFLDEHTYLERRDDPRASTARREAPMELRVRAGAGTTSVEVRF